MTSYSSHGVFAEDENGKPTDQIAWIEPADEADAIQIVNRSTEGSDGRSNWVWIRLADNTLALAVFPQGNTYCEFETCCEWQNAKAPA